jgi:hypothetical protein
MPAAGRQNVNTDKIMSDRVPAICTALPDLAAVRADSAPEIGMQQCCQRIGGS